jgi:hypothetical protein
MNSMAQLAQHQAGSKHRAQLPFLQSTGGVGAANINHGIVFNGDSRSQPDLRANVSQNWAEEAAAASELANGGGGLPARGLVGMGSLPNQAWSEMSVSNGNGNPTEHLQQNFLAAAAPTRSWSEDVVNRQASMPISKLLLPREGDPGPPPERLATMGSFSDEHPAGAGVASETPETATEAAALTAAAAGIDRSASSSFELARTFITLVKKGEVADVKTMIDDGIDVDCREAGCPALHWAIFMRRIETALQLIQSGAVRDLVDRDNQTALHICLHPRHGLSMLDDDGSADATKLASELLLAGWAADARDSHGRTALHHSAEQGNVAVTKLLLGAGASPDSHNNMGFSPSDVATLKARVATDDDHFAECRDLLRAASWQSPAPTASPMSVPLASNGTISDSRTEISPELRNGEEIDLLFRPLMAALCSFNDQGKHEGGVELSQLASRLRPILDIVGLKCKAYATHAMNRGFITMRQSANRKQHYVCIAPAYRNGSFSAANKRAAAAAVAAGKTGGSSSIIGGDGTAATASEGSSNVVLDERTAKSSITTSVSMPSISSLQMQSVLVADVRLRGGAPGSPGPSGSDGDLGGRAARELLSPYVPPGCYSPMGQQQRVERDLMGLLDSPGPPPLSPSISAPHQDFTRHEPQAEVARGVAGGRTAAAITSFNERLFYSDPFSKEAFSSSTGPEPLFGGMGRMGAAWGAPAGITTGAGALPASSPPDENSSVESAFRRTTGGDEDIERLNAALMQWPTAGAIFDTWDGGGDPVAEAAVDSASTEPANADDGVGLKTDPLVSE